jgi:hypothetical protein
MANADWYDPAQVRKGGPTNVMVPKIEDLLNRDGYLRLHEREIRRRCGRSRETCFARHAFNGLSFQIWQL